MEGQEFVFPPSPFGGGRENRESPICSFRVIIYSIIGIVVFIAWILTIVFLVPKSPSVPPAGHHVVITKQIPRLPGFGDWCYIEFNTSHAGWNKNQSPSQWSHIFYYSGTSDNIQFTPYDEKGTISQGGSMSTIVEGYGAFNVVFVSLEYWGEAPWRLFVGLGPSGQVQQQKESICKNFFLF